MTHTGPMIPRHLRAALDSLGWPGVPTRDALSEFQRGYALGPPLTVDGKNGPRTRAAIRSSLSQLMAGKPTASPSFSFTEFACKCAGRYPGCRRQRVHRDLLTALEKYRRLAGPVQVVSGYRCIGHNRAVGGASSSQHLYGAAVDVEYRLGWRDVARLRLFAGIGRNKRTGKVRHVDVRHVAGHNSTGGTPDRPTVWDYPG